MKNLFFIGVLVFSKITNAQELKFDVKAYTENSKQGFHEMDKLINSSKGQKKICDRKYRANLNEKKLYFYENGKLDGVLKINNIIHHNNQLELIVETSLGEANTPTEFIIYIDFSGKKMTSENISKIKFFWYNPWDDVSYVKRIE
jgi:hypothetical protein